MLLLLQPIDNSLAYSGNASLTLTISPTFYLASNGVTVKCSGCSGGDTGMVSGTVYSAVENGTGTNGIKTLVNAGNYNLATTLVTNMSNLFDGNPSFKHRYWFLGHFECNHL